MLFRYITLTNQKYKLGTYGPNRQSDQDHVCIIKA